MNAQKLLLASFLAFASMFFLGFVWHFFLMGSLMEEELTAFHGFVREDPELAYYILGYLALSVIMAYIYPIGVEQKNKLGQGFRFGMLMGLFHILPMSLITYGLVDYGSLKIIVFESLWHMVEQGIGGIVIAFAYGNVIVPDS